MDEEHRIYPDRRLYIASGNMNKIKEFSAILSDKNFEIYWPDKAGIKYEPEEDGETFKDNALIKAQALHKITGGYVIADDSGLSVKALDGQPGVHSARFGGEKSGYPQKFKKLQSLFQEKGKLDMSASFVCVIALLLPDGNSYHVREKLKGELSFPPKGKHGFGYDPIFKPLGRKQTLAEMDELEKNQISHRARQFNPYLF